MGTFSSFIFDLSNTFAAKDFLDSRFYTRYTLAVAPDPSVLSTL